MIIPSEYLKMMEQTHRQQYPKQGFKADETPAEGRPRRKPETLEAALAENKELRAENKELRTVNRKIRSESNEVHIARGGEEET